MSEIINGVVVDAGDIDLTEEVTFEKGVEVSSGYGYKIDGDNALSFPIANTNLAVGPTAGDALAAGAASNVAVGYEAMLYNETGDYNVAVGTYAGKGASGQSYSNNTFVGNAAGTSNTVGGNNVCVGYHSGYNNKTGNYNTTVGTSAGKGAPNQNYSNNTFIGFEAGYVNTTGPFNTFVGYRAGYNNTSASSNVKIGQEAGYFNQVGTHNVLVGMNAGFGASGQSYSYNVCIGYEAGLSNTTGSGNFFGGYRVAYSNTTGNSNVAIGREAGYYNETGSYNVVIGQEAGKGVTGNNYSQNVFIGYQAGYSNPTGWANVFIGYQAGYSETASNRLYIANSNTADPLIYGEFDNGKLKINGDLEVTGSLVSPANAGLVRRPIFLYKDADEIYVGGGVYHHHGTTEQIVYWNSQLTIQLSGAGADDWYYLYLDDSAIVTADTNLLTASEFVWSTTAPAWDEAKKGQYNGLDRCIFAVLTDGSNNILLHYHDGGRFVEYDARIADLDNVDVDTGFDDVTLTIPAFGDNAQALVTFRGKWANAEGGSVFYRKNGSATTSNIVARIESDNEGPVNTRRVTVDASQIIEVAMAQDTDSTMWIYTV